MSRKHARWLFFKALASLCFAVAAFALIALTFSEETASPDWLPFNIHHGPWLAAFLKLFGVLLITPAAYLTLYRLALIGRISPPTHETVLEGGRVELHLPTGFRWGLFALCIGLCCAILFALWVMDEPVGIWIFTAPLWIGAFYGGLYVLLLDGWFDGEQLVLTDLRLRHRSYNWGNLESMTLKREQNEAIFDFETQGKARLSLFMQGSGAAMEHGVMVLEGH
jgi:hypothetical protein